MSDGRCDTLGFLRGRVTIDKRSLRLEKKGRGRRKKCWAGEEGGEVFAKTDAIDPRLVTPRCLFRL